MSRTGAFALIALTLPTSAWVTTSPLNESAASRLIAEAQRCPSAVLRVSMDSIAYLPTERATFGQLRRLCPAAVDTFILTPVDAVLEPAVAFPFEQVTVIAVQTRNDPGPNPIRLVDEAASPDYWLVPVARGVTFNQLPLSGLTWGRLQQVFGRGVAQLSVDFGLAGFCGFPSVIFVLNMGDASAVSVPEPERWRPGDDAPLVRLELGRALRGTWRDQCP